jgi:hypothetical protein
MGAKNRVEIGLSYRPAKLIPGLFKSLKIPPLIDWYLVRGTAYEYVRVYVLV